MILELCLFVKLNIIELLLILLIIVINIYSTIYN